MNSILFHQIYLEIVQNVKKDYLYDIQSISLGSNWLRVGALVWAGNQLVFLLAVGNDDLETDDLSARWWLKQGGANGSSEPIEASSPAPSSTPFPAVDATYAKPNKVQRAGNKDQLDSMLGNLQVRYLRSALSAISALSASISQLKSFVKHF